MSDPLQSVREAPPAREASAYRSGSAKRRRQHVEQFRTDDDEHAELQRRAWEDGRLSVSAYCRKQALGDPGPRHRRHPPADVRLLAQNFSALNRIGGNLNQGVRALNQIALAAPAAPERDRLAYEIAELRALLRADIEALLPVLNANRRAFGDDREG